MPNDNNENETKNAAPPKAAITTNDDDDNNNNNSAPPPPPKSPLEGKFQAAATALAEADVVLLVTDAGWSADSGLPVYADIAQVKAYERLCGCGAAGNDGQRSISLLRVLGSGSP